MLKTLIPKIVSVLNLWKQKLRNLQGHSHPTTMMLVSHQPMVTRKISNRPLISKTTDQFKLKPKLTELNLNTFLVYFHLFSDKSIFNLTWCFTYSNYPFNISYCSILFDHYWWWNCLWGWLDPSFNWFCNCLCCWFI